MRFFPIFLDLESGDVVLVGNTEAATNKLRLLRSAQAKVRWFVPQHSGVEVIDGVRVIARNPEDEDLAGASLVVSAAGEPLDSKVSGWAKARNIPVNVVDRMDLSTFIMPSIVDRGDVVVAVGTQGASPVLARRLRERIEALLPARIGDFASLMAKYRFKLTEKLASIRERKNFWEDVIDGPIAEAVYAGQTEAAEAELARLIETGGKSRTGIVHIVGAGPGDPDLLTIKALRVMQDADIVFHDDLVTPEILERVRRDAERVFVGKRKGSPGIGQEAIHRLIVEAAREGKRVVRLKGGDPFIFGRGGEEIELLRVNNIPYIVVPGITAALGCAAEAELPLTFRNESTRIVFVTAHRAEESKPDWSGLTDPLTTVVAYMGLGEAQAVSDGLIAAGRPRNTPAAILARGTRRDAKAGVGTLEDLSALAAQVGHGPALLVIGEVVKRSAAWRDLEKQAVAA